MVRAPRLLAFGGDDRGAALWRLGLQPGPQEMSEAKSGYCASCVCAQAN